MVVFLNFKVHALTIWENNISDCLKFAPKGAFFFPYPTFSQVISFPISFSVTFLVLASFQLLIDPRILPSGCTDVNSASLPIFKFHWRELLGLRHPCSFLSDVNSVLASIRIMNVAGYTRFTAFVYVNYVGRNSLANKLFQTLFAGSLQLST